MNAKILRPALLSFLAVVPSLQGNGIVINEIMYEPASENAAEEYIELYNAAATNVNLSGWQLDSGVSFVFPAGTQLPPGAYLVVAADTNVFRAKYTGVDNVIGNWTGTLANRGERVRLSDAGGNTISSVTYADGGDWGVRMRGAGEAHPLEVWVNGTTATFKLFGNFRNGDVVEISGADQPEYNGVFTISGASSSGFNVTLPFAPAEMPTGVLVVRQLTDYTRTGWAWSSRAKGLGSSLELVTAALPGEYGQNWKASAVAHGTPGQPNSVAQTNAAPLLLNAAHFPVVPSTNQPITITARLLDEQTAGMTASLRWRLDAVSPLAFSLAPMFDDGLHGDGTAGDGLFGALIPAQTNNAIVEFYLEARDAQNNLRTWPAPALSETNTFVQAANALLQVDSSAYTGAAPLYKLIMRESERAELHSYPANGTWRQSDAAMNLTFIAIDGTGTSVRYTSSARNRGAGSRSANPMNYRVSLTSDNPWQGTDGLNVNSRYPQAQVAGYALGNLAGLNSESARAVQVRVNNRNLASTGSSGYGHYTHSEPVGADYARRHFPNDPDGNVYRASSGNHTAGLSYIGTNIYSYTSAGYSKNSNSGENDWTDLMELCRVLSDVPDADYADAVRQVVNVDQWMHYFAVFTLLLSRETSLATGTGDDFGMYRGVVDPRFQILAHDYDTILNQGDSTGGYQDSIFRMVQAVTGPIGYNLNATNLNRFFLHPEFAPIYYAHLKELCDAVFSPPQMSLTLDRALQSFVPQNVINQMKTFGSNRVNYVLSQIPLTITASATLTTNWGYLYTTEPVVTLFGSANAIDTRSVLVGGLPATWSALDARWTNTLALQPGINRILVQSFNTNNVEFDRTFIEVWYDDGTASNVSGALTADTIWSPADGPYVVTSTLTIDFGATLTILPGTSVQLASGANLVVAGGGRLIAEGTDTARIRFSRVPGTGAWGGITINGDPISPETRITYAHIDGNNTTAIHSASGTVFLDHLTFGNTNRQYLSLDDSSFVVSDCEFPRTSGTFEPVHGTGGIKAGGHGIFRRNYFGPTSGYNDVVDFTGGNRPGPILQFINNVFAGTGDDLLDLDGTDAWVEGNIFMHAHKNGSPDTASAVSGGDDSGATSEITVIGNLIYDCDHAAMVKGGNFTTLINNTVVRQTKTGGTDTDAAVACLADEGFAQGAGMWIEGNILYDIEKLVRFYTNSAVTFTNNLMPLTWSGPGGGNSTNDPLLNYVPPVTATSNFTSWAQAQVMWQWFGLRAGSPAIGAGPNRNDQGGVIPQGVSISGAPVGTNNQTSATLVVGVNRTGNGIPSTGWPNGSGFTHYKWRRDGGAWSAETPIATPISLTSLANGPHYVEVSGKNDAGFYQDDPIFGADAAPTRTATWTVDTSHVPPAALTAVRLNEILAGNQGAYLAGGEYPDVVELFNGSTLDANLAGVGLTDDPAVPYKFTFPPGTTLSAGGYLVVLMDNNNATPGLHAGFNLAREGGRLALFASPAGSGVLMDEVTFGPQITDRSIGRVTDGSWALNMPTLGAANLGAPTGDPRKLRINEWLASGQGILSDDFIELYNTDALPIDLGGFALTDNPIGWPDRFRIVPLSFIAPTNVLLYLADGQTNNGPEHLSFSLAAERGIIALLDRQLAVIDEIVYGPQTTGISQGRIPNGADTLTFFSTPTPGSGNPAPATGCTVTTTTLALMPYTQVWRYNQTQDLSGLSWMAPNYNDSAWPTGPGLLAYETDGWISGLLGTTLADPRTAAPGLTTPRVYYFRTRFTVTTNLAGFEVTARMRVDDGVVVYLNGTELTRVRVGAGNITYSTLATTSTPGDAQTDETVTIPLDRLVAGTNVVAVVLLQNAATSSDSVWGMAIDAVRSQTNCIQAPVVLNEVFANNLSFTNADGTVSDWVELFNPSATPTTLSGMSLTDDTTDPRRWVFPAGVVLPPGGYLAVRCDGNMPASSNTVGILNTGFGLAANGDEIYLFDAGGALLEGVTFGLQAPDYPIGRLPNGTGGWTIVGQTLGGQNLATATGNPTLLRVNEWMADPRASDDWFEIFNPNPQPVAIGGCYLTDDLAERNKHRIPALSFIGTGLKGAYAVFFADNNPQNGADHVNFRLSGDGEALGLYSPAQEAIDIITFGTQVEGVSEGRLPDGVANLVAFPRSVSQGNANYLPIDSIVISEVLAHSDLPLEDAIEIQNVSRETVDVSGWWLTDARDDVYRFQIPSGTVLPPGGFAVFYEYQFNTTPGELPSFALSSSEGDEVYLVQTDSQGQLTGYRAVVNFGPSENGVSFGRYPTSVGEDFVAMSALSFGTTVTRNDPTNIITEFRTGQGATNAYPLVGPVVINEIMYNPRPDGTNDNTLDEYIELLNTTAAPVPLFDPSAPTNTWHLRDGVDFEFPANVTLPAGGFALVVNFNPTNTEQLATFRAKFNVGEGVPVFGPYTGKLDNGGEGINLRKPDMPGPDGNAPYVLVERVVFDDDAPWASLADGNTNELVGASLQRRVASEYGNDPVNWLAGLPTAGAPNGEALETLPAITTQPQGQNVPPGASPVLTVVATGAPTLRYQWRKDGVDIVGETAGSLTLNSITASAAGIYTVRISNPAGAVLSAPAEIAVQQPPEITRQPLSHLAVADSPTSFDVVARGSLPLSYQWRKEGVPVSGATENRFTITNATLADQGNYSVVVTNLYGAVTSTVATLQVFTRPTIIVQPQPTNLYIGGTISLNVAATGTDPLFYQWRLGNTPLPGQTNPVLTVNNAQVAQSGAYSVVVSNMIGTAVSDPVQVNVLVPPTLSVRATDPTATELGLTSGQFTLTRSGDPVPALSVNITITGTATPGSDYVAIAGPVLFDSGVTSAPVVVTPLDDATLESIETVVLTVNPGAIYVLGAPTSATVNVIDDDNQPPLVTLTNPPAGSLFHTPAIIPLGVVTSDPDGTVTKVEYYDFETNKVATSTNAPFLATWTNAAPGVHQLTAVASDNFGATGASLPVEITVNASPTVLITSPLNGASFPLGENIAITVSATDLDGYVTQVEFWQGTNLLSTDASSPFGMLWSDVPVGSYSLTARATDDRGGVTLSPAANITVRPPVIGLGDMFTNRGVLYGFSNLVTGNNLNFTREVGEPRHDLQQTNNSTHSAWLTWTAPATGVVTMETTDSGFDTVLAVYTNNPPTAQTLATLVRVISNDDADSSTLQSLVQFTATAGVTYQIAIDGYNNLAFGNIVFRLTQNNPYPVITTQPLSQTVNAGTDVAFNITATGPAPLSYRWLFNGTLVPDATTNSLQLASVQAANEGFYAAVVNNTAGAVTSTPALLTVRTPATIVSQPQTVVTEVGSNATFNVTAAGNPPIRYQWAFNGAPLTGKTNASLTIADAQYTNGGTYTVTATNHYGTATSDAAKLILRPRFVGVERISGGVLLTHLGSPGVGYGLQGSTNFTDWTTLREMTNSAVQQTTTDTNLPAGGRVYRLQVLP